MRAQNRHGQGEIADLGFEAGDNGRLGKGVGKIFERYMGAERGVVDDL